LWVSPFVAAAAARQQSIFRHDWDQTQVLVRVDLIKVMIVRIENLVSHLSIYQYG